MVTVFFSYSHKDETLRDELEVHLSGLKREGIIGTWHDRRIGAGRDFAGSISENLERADVVLLLVSPYFLASDYCYDVEMKRAMERHASGSARVIPVILHPCDWHSAPFGTLLAVPRDGKPISMYANVHQALLEVALAVRAAARELGKGEVANKPITPAAMPPNQQVELRSSNLRLKKSFSDADRDSFLDESFEYIARYFEGSLQELENRNRGITARFKRIDSTRFTAHIYRDGRTASECSVRLGGLLSSGIGFSFDPNSTNSYNESMSVTDDGHALCLKPMGMAMMGSAKESLSQEGAAEYLWTMLIQRLQ